jgi:hypothetical protein
VILTDNETKVDLLNNEAIAKTIIALLREKPERPVTIGVHGDWGAGKSSILEMIESGLAGQDGVLCLKFNGWRFQGFEDAKIALIEGIVTGLIEKRPLLSKAGAVVTDIFRRIDWLKIARHGGGGATTRCSRSPTRSPPPGAPTQRRARAIGRDDWPGSPAAAGPPSSIVATSGGGSTASTSPPPTNV